MSSLREHARRGRAPRRALAPAVFALVAAGIAANEVFKAVLDVGFASPRGLPSISARTHDRTQIARPARGGDDSAPKVDAASLTPGQEVTGVLARWITDRDGREVGAKVNIGLSKEAFVPVSKISAGFLDQPSVNSGLVIGQEVTGWVVEMRERAQQCGQISLCRSKTLPRADASLFKDVKPDEWVPGYAARITDFGVFVAMRPPNGDVSEAQGLLHVREMGADFVEDPAAAFKLGQDVKVRVLAVDGGKIILSTKQPMSERVKPFLDVTPEEFLPGVVRRFEDYGAFVEVTSPTGETLEGLLHNSRISEDGVEDPAMVLEIDQELKVHMLSINAEDGKMVLSLLDTAEA